MAHKWVFKFFLKLSTDSAERRCRGSSFQSRGADAEKARSPKVLVLDLGMSNKIPWEDLSSRPVLRTLTSSDRYRGARPCRHLNVKRRILKSILKETGSQCRDFKIEMFDILANFGIPRHILAALFWIRCNLFRFRLDMPKRRELQ